VDSKATRRIGREEFKELCHAHGLAATHQREAIYRALLEGEEHPTPEELLARVRRRIPSLSLATVYKTLHSFQEAGIAGEVGLNLGAFRVDANPEPHHHAICRQCRAIFDVPASDDNAGPPRGLPEGFQMQRCSIEVQGVCRECAAKNRTAPSQADVA